MKPIFENIEVAINSSLKIQTFTHGESCELTNWHIHPEYELVYVKNGNGTLQISGKNIPYTDGVLLFLGPNIPHADFGNKDNSDNFEVVIQFGKEFLEDKLVVFPEFKGINKLIKDSKHVIIFKKKIKNRYGQRFEALQKMDDTQRLLSFIGILHSLSTTNYNKLIAAENTINTIKSQDVMRLEYIFEYVNKNYADKISIGLIANLIGLTSNSFCRFFKHNTNQTFVQFLNQFRTKKALEFFIQNNSSVSEVMYKCGYNDPSYFTRQFKKYQGNVPSFYITKD
ncbi:helix-turn-helix domain-containing protein [Kriegella sp. EG-1]|nr:helix-turn-helix domain-containing protein [Flavobacteriaceae bacterium EG-1]